MKEFSAKQFGGLLRRTMLAGVCVCGALLLAGALLNLFSAGSGVAAIKAGLLALLLTPAARLAMLVYGYWRGKEYYFSAASFAVLVLLAVSAFV
jgi:uncharacterized membrane protein